MGTMQRASTLAPMSIDRAGGSIRQRESITPRSRPIPSI
jgi:hypothetical protein